MSRHWTNEQLRGQDDERLLLIVHQHCNGELPVSVEELRAVGEERIRRWKRREIYRFLALPAAGAIALLAPPMAAIPVLLVWILHQVMHINQRVHTQSLVVHTHCDGAK